ncbi:hypothetical protein [Amycolatopsis sp.]|uniref:hypothetical protein n=1 Tax=Amycolatopsis sp. TaxID=37632 RepID=UPI002C319182|nr:hypothetical protein [Amycolatopsis sp.]HVV08493.1 hypothetical protein [Amycolatopsis sp.]
MRVAPSLMVTLADHRRQNLVLTRTGRELLAKCTRIAERLDEKFTAERPGTGRSARSPAGKAWPDQPNWPGW